MKRRIELLLFLGLLQVTCGGFLTAVGIWSIFVNKAVVVETYAVHLWGGLEFCICGGVGIMMSSTKNKKTIKIRSILFGFSFVLAVMVLIAACMWSVSNRALSHFSLLVTSPAAIFLFAMSFLLSVTGASEESHKSTSGFRMNGLTGSFYGHIQGDRHSTIIDGVFGIPEHNAVVPSRKILRQPATFSDCYEYPFSFKSFVSVQKCDAVVSISNETQGNVVSISNGTQRDVVSISDETQGDVVSIANGTQRDVVSISDETQGDVVSISDETKGDVVSTCENKSHF